jgi:hypothetical protein
MPNIKQGIYQDKKYKIRDISLKAKLKISLNAKIFLL